MFKRSTQLNNCCLSISQNSTHDCYVVLQKRIVNSLSLEIIKQLSFISKICKIYMNPTVQRVLFLIGLVYILYQFFNLFDIKNIYWGFKNSILAWAYHKLKLVYVIMVNNLTIYWILENSSIQELMQKFHFPRITSLAQKNIS